MSEQNANKKLALNIVSGKAAHKGFGAGSIDLSNVSAVIVDGGEAYVDNGALHAKSRVEKGIKFVADRGEVPNGRRCFIVWVAVDRDEDGGRYAGLAACEMAVDPEARRGWKVLAEHVNRMDRAMKRQVLVENLNGEEKAALKRTLVDTNPQWWERTGEDVKQALAD
ncbi:YwhD family protein [Gorillibacterium sp. sgz500922]|uniref:YwhD family protein n=1 Tax=Gorillibacterium sp. sgz500922 TaxID=3446694 RepID=UPI003F67E353